MRPLFLITTLTLTVIGQFATPLGFATCGGGGGGGGGAQITYTTNWTPYAPAYETAKEKSVGVLLYLKRDKDDSHTLFTSKPMADRSEKSPMVKLEGDELEKLRKEFEVSAKKHIIVVTDWHGNEISRFSASRSTQNFKLKRVVGAIASAKKFFKRVEKDAKKFQKKGNDYFGKEKWSRAAKEFFKVAGFKGVKEAEEASLKLGEIRDRGTKLVTEIVEREEDEKSAKITALGKVAKDFKGTEVEKLARDEIARLKGEKTKQAWVPLDRSTLLAEWQAEFEFETIDELALERSLEVQAKVFKGAMAERTHQYDVAQRAYEEAVTMDPTDAVARRFLAEYHRHHTGDWALARSHFDRILKEGGDAYSRAIATHGIGKMTIHGGEFEKGVKTIEESISIYPTQLAYRNLAVYWHSEGQFEKARSYVDKAVTLDPKEPYTRVFEAVYIALDGDPELALRRIAETPFDLSMSYNVACVYSAMRDKERTLKFLHQHFQEYEFTDVLRAKEMWEARTDINFKWLFEDPDFRQVTHLADGRG